MNYALFVEYEGILLGNTQKFSQLSLTRLREKTTAKQILRFIFEELLEWTPEQVRDYLTPQIAEKVAFNQNCSSNRLSIRMQSRDRSFLLSCFCVSRTDSYFQTEAGFICLRKSITGKTQKISQKFFPIWRRRIQFGNLPCLCVKSLWKLSFSGRTIWFFRRQTQILPFCQRTQINRAYS